MEVFFAYRVEEGFVRLDADESAHCVRVLRHREGDAVEVIDGCGTLYRCTLTDASPREAMARIVSAEPGWGSHPYRLTLAVCPTKNMDRYEWMVEKATEIGVDRIVPVIGERSERRVLKPERLRRIVLSAAKQSLKGAVPEIEEPVSVREFVAALPAPSGVPLELPAPSVTVLIGPEGDFSPEEVRAAMEAGFIPTHLGPSRLRTETAGITAAEAVYLSFIPKQ